MAFATIIQYIELGYLSFPFKVNPVLSILYGILLAYVPHVLKMGLLKKQLQAKGLKYDVTNGRANTTVAIDDSPLGKKIGAYTGCHQNALETLPFYIGAILSALHFHVDNEILARASASFLIVRVAYTVIYLTSLNGRLRSVAFELTGLVIITILLLAYSKSP